MIILCFWTKFTEKKYFHLKTKQAVQGLQAFAFCVVNVKSTVVFKHFEDLIIVNIPKEKLVISWLLSSFYLKIVKSFSNSTVQIAMISKVMIKFWSKFQLQIPLQFYRTVEKVEICDGNGQKFWQVTPSFQPSHFGYYFVFSRLRFKHIQYKGIHLHPKFICSSKSYKYDNYDKAKYKVSPYC